MQYAQMLSRFLFSTALPYHKKLFSSVQFLPFNPLNQPFAQFKIQLAASPLPHHHKQNPATLTWPMPDREYNLIFAELVRAHGTELMLALCLLCLLYISSSMRDSHGTDHSCRINLPVFLNNLNHRTSLQQISTLHQTDPIFLTLSPPVLKLCLAHYQN